jgi:multicomponent Na+:H+ antiporter subunit E
MRTAFHYLLVGLGLFGFWVVLSGKLDAVHLVMGGVCAVGVTALSGRLLYSELEAPAPPAPRRWLSFLPWGRLALYLPWIGLEILKANLAMVPFILGPSSRLRPRLVRLRPGLSSEVASFVLANSITLTPGTLTLEHSDGEYLVHALDEAAAGGLLAGALSGKVAWTFKEQAR